VNDNGDPLLDRLVAFAGAVEAGGVSRQAEAAWDVLCGVVSQTFAATEGLAGVCAAERDRVLREWLERYLIDMEEDLPGLLPEAQ
jgi:hypothetical protein